MTGASGTVLVMLAHNDDEYFVSARIERERKLGHEVHVVYTTYGSAYGADATGRVRESERALAELGVPVSRIHSVGYELKVFDGAAYLNLESLTQALLARFEDTEFHSVVTMAWEGGHPDHDATHLVAAALARRWSLSEAFYEFPAYHRCGMVGPLFRAGKFASTTASTAIRVDERFGFRQAFRFLFLMRHYRSQKKSFLGLFPDSFYRFLCRRQQQLRRVHGVDYRRPPHPGQLLYERRFKRPYGDFHKTVSPFVDAWL